MANDEFQIPNKYNESELRAQIDSLQHSPEVLATPFEQIKAHEAEIHAYRETAWAVEPKAKRWLGGLVFAPQDRTVGSFLDEESLAGEQLFGEGHRFWLDTKTNNTVFHNDVGDWYYMKVNEADSVVHYQTTPTGMHKLYQGREYPLSNQEVAMFARAVPLYKDIVVSRASRASSEK